MKKKEEWYSFSQQNNGAMVETDIRMHISDKRSPFPASAV